MWPQALQMTRDECRGILRRLELESYSQVISVFRAQGGLSEAKAKLLEELRGIFHISNERHRAEARRVANDEQLATIAEAISGPNTWQEWSREGRRPYPMLPRVAPQTALALIANNIAEETASENGKLPYPAETSEVVKEEQQQIEKQKASSERNNYVVTSEPFKVPKIPTGTKKNLKRNINEQHQSSGGAAGKKRATVDNSLQKNHQQGNRQLYPHITANSPQSNSVAMPSSSHERKQFQQAAAQEQHQNNQYLQRQRYFHHQHQLTKQKAAKKAAAAASGKSGKRQATPAKSGRRANHKALMEQQQQQALKHMQMTDQQQQHPQTLPPGPMHIDLTTSQAVANAAILTQQQIDMQFVTYATQHQPPSQIFMEDLTGTQTQLLSLTSANPGSSSVLSTSLITPLSSSSSTSLSSTPQIAASKRDISKNLNKLQQLQQNQFQTNLAAAVSSSIPISPTIPSHDLQTSLGTILSSSSANVGKNLEKSLISTTPVQKYIVEERQPGGGNISTAPGSIINLQNLQSASGISNTSTAHIIQVSNASGQQAQLMTLPQYSAAASKLRAVNTTLIAPGAKISPTPNKKISSMSTSLISGTHSPINAGALHELANVASTQSQVLHIVETSQGGNSVPTSSASFSSPLHTPPAIIQIQNSSQAPSGATATEITASAGTQGKVLTTKILPLVLGGTSGSSLIANSSTVTGSIVSTATTSTTSSSGATFIKNLPSSVVLNTNTTNLTPVTVTGTIFSTLGAGATVFRKHPNILKTSMANCGTSKSPTSTTSGAPHIISNVKLTPMNVTTSTSGTPLCSTNTTFKNVLPSTSGMVRTSVKICQSPNGKVVIQPAGLIDGSKMKLNTTTLPHKILTSTSNSITSGSTTTASVGGGQRIAIQKVQIIPAPLGSPAGTSILQTTGNSLNTKTTSLSGKSNMIFMPSSTATNVRPVTLSKMGNNILLKSSASAQMSSSSDNLAKTNIVVLGQSIATSPQTSLKDAHGQKIDATNMLINEDTPLDILNMPIVMATGVVSSSDNTVTVLPGNIIESNSNNNTSTSALSPIIVEQSIVTTSTQQQPQQTVILGATDWEMELDQATAAHNNSTTQHAKPKTHKQKRSISTSSSTSNSSLSLSTLTSTVNSNKQKRLNNDLISIELKTKSHHHQQHQHSPGQLTTLSSANSNNIIVVDSFEDVIVEEHDDEMSTSNVTEQVVTSSETSDIDINQQSNNDEQPKFLDMQIYQQHDGITGSKSEITIVSNQQESADDIQQQTCQIIQLPSSTVVEQHQQEEQQQQLEQQQTETEVDAGFDETIVTEIDENTAIEYIEEDGVVSGSVTTTSSSTITTATTSGVSATSLTSENEDKPQNLLKTTYNSNHLELENTTTTAKNDNKDRITETEISVEEQLQLQEEQNLETKKANNSGTQVEP